MSVTHLCRREPCSSQTLQAAGPEAWWPWTPASAAAWGASSWLRDRAIQQVGTIEGGARTYTLSSPHAPPAEQACVATPASLPSRPCSGPAPARRVGCVEREGEGATDAPTTNPKSLHPVNLQPMHSQAPPTIRAQARSRPPCSSAPQAHHRAPPALASPTPKEDSRPVTRLGGWWGLSAAARACRCPWRAVWTQQGQGGPSSPPAASTKSHTHACTSSGASAPHRPHSPSAP